jgi:hypothetical protein
VYLQTFLVRITLLFVYTAAVWCGDDQRIADELKSPPVEIPLKSVLGEAAYNDAIGSNEYRYVGNDKCRLCHRDFFVGRKQDHHDHAMDYIKESEYSNNPKCLVCHATGYGVKTGFVSMAQTPRLANVQCEGCHGPGSNHLKIAAIEKKGGGFLSGTDRPDRLKKMCKSCHTARWDRSYTDFESAYNKYKKAVPK